MAIAKYGTGKILPEPDDDQKIAKKQWSEEDEEALKEENTRADAPPKGGEG